MFGNLKVKLTPTQRIALAKLCQKYDPHFVIGTNTRPELDEELRKVALYCIRKQWLPEVTKPKPKSSPSKPASQNLNDNLYADFTARGNVIKAGQFSNTLTAFTERARQQLPKSQRKSWMTLCQLALIRNMAGLILLEDTAIIKPTFSDTVHKQFEGHPFAAMTQLVGGFLKHLSAYDFANWVLAVKGTNTCDMFETPGSELLEALNGSNLPSDRWFKEFGRLSNLKRCMLDASHLIQKASGYAKPLTLGRTYWHKAFRRDVAPNSIREEQFIKYGCLTHLKHDILLTASEEANAHARITEFIDRLLPAQPTFWSRYARQYLDAITLAVVVEQNTFDDHMKTRRHFQTSPSIDNGEALNAKFGCHWPWQMNVHKIANFDVEMDWETVIGQFIISLSRSQQSKFLHSVASEVGAEGQMLRCDLEDDATYLDQHSSAAFAIARDAVSDDIHGLIVRQCNFWNFDPDQIKIDWKAILKDAAQSAIQSQQ